MGYGISAAIGAAISSPSRPVYCICGDGGLQQNIQELMTCHRYQLNIKVLVMNNGGYGIIKQFQDAYFEGRHFATGVGYSQPNFGNIAEAFGIDYAVVKDLK